jgi:hypothetical protein
MLTARLAPPTKIRRKKFGGGRKFFYGGFSASRIFFRRIYGATKFCGGGGQIRRLRGLENLDFDLAYIKVKARYAVLSLINDPQSDICLRQSRNFYLFIY